jgi:uncharacterized protein (TIGR02996 family)
MAKAKVKAKAKAKAKRLPPPKLTLPSVQLARNAQLEAEIREHREDPAPYLVYADWLQAQGSPFGEMIVFAHAKQHKRANAVARKLGLPSADVATFGSRYGFWQWLRLENVDWMDDHFEPLPIVRTLFASPLCAVLEELRLGIVRWDYNDQPAIIAEAGRHAWARDLSRLHLGDVPSNVDMDHHTIGVVGKLITKHFPNLTWLKLHSGSQTWRDRKETFGFAGLALPKLKELVIETCAMSSKRMKWLTAAKLPALERLEVWFGAHDREGTTRIDDVEPVLDGKLFPRLVHLGLRNTELVGDIIRVLPASKLARQLESLDLSMGTLGDDDATQLAGAAAQFPALKSLNVGESYLTPKGMRVLKAAFKGVKIAANEQKQPYDWNPGGRYVSVLE